MDQITMISENKLRELERKANWYEIYTKFLIEAKKELYLDYISVDPVNSNQYNFLILCEMKNEIKRKRLKLWEKLRRC